MGILQARILDQVTMLSSRGSSHPRDWTLVFHIAGGFFTSWATLDYLYSSHLWKGVGESVSGHFTFIHVTPKWRRRKNWNSVSGLWGFWFLNCHSSHHCLKEQSSFPKHFPHCCKLRYWRASPGQHSHGWGWALPWGLQPCGNVLSLKKKSEIWILCENSQYLDVGCVAGFVFK